MHQIIALLTRLYSLTIFSRLYRVLGVVGSSDWSISINHCVTWDQAAKMASGDSSGMGWTGEGRSFVDQLIDLGLWSYLDDKTEYDISVGKGGTTYGVFRFHHYIVLESPLLPANSNRLIFELMKKPDAVGRLMVTPKVRIFSHDRKPDYKLTVKATTLRLIAVVSHSYSESQ